MHADNSCNALCLQLAILVPRIAASLRQLFAEEDGSDKSTDFLQAELEHVMLTLDTNPLLLPKVSSSMRGEWHDTHTPISLGPESSFSNFKSRYLIFSLPATHSSEANDGRLG